MCIKFGILWKKRSALELISFWNQGMEKAELVKCSKIPMLEHLSRVNMLKDPKECLDLHGVIFLIFLDPYDRNSARKICF